MDLRQTVPPWAFRSQEGYPVKEYRFMIQIDSTYRFLVATDEQQLTLRQENRDAIHRDQANILAVVADKDSIHLYVKHQLLAHIHYSTYTKGQIGFYTSSNSPPKDTANEHQIPQHIPQFQEQRLLVQQVPVIGPLLDGIDDLACLARQPQYSQRQLIQPSFHIWMRNTFLSAFGWLRDDLISDTSAIKVCTNEEFVLYPKRRS